MPMSTIINPRDSPPGMPAPELVFAGDLRVEDYPGSSSSQRYPVEVWALANGDQYAIVSDVWGNTSLMNASERIAVAIRAQWRVHRIIEHWPDGILGSEKFAYSSETGGNHPFGADTRSELARLGLVIPA